MQNSILLEYCRMLNNPIRKQSEELEEMSEFYNQTYAWKQNDNWLGWFQSEALQPILRQLDSTVCEILPRNSKVLEVGAGAGDQSIYLAEKGYSVVGIEASNHAVKWANEKTQRLRSHPDFCQNQNIPIFLQDDARTLATQSDSSFDAVLDGHCWHFITKFIDRGLFLSAVKRVLKPNGILFIQSVCNEPHGLTGYDPATRTQFHGTRPVTFFGTPESLGSELTHAGFQILNEQVMPRQDEQSCDIYLCAAKVQ